MLKVSRDTPIFAMSAQNTPVLHVEPGAQIQFETWDALHGQVRTEDGGLAGLDMSRVNPATGPVYVNGAEAGDILSVKIDKIEVEDSGFAACGPGMGVMGKVLQKGVTKIVPVKGDMAHYSDKIQIPLSKMVGVLGVAPAPKDGETPCGVPGPHGGNLDCKEVKEGVTVLLPVSVPGALLAMGDIHAVMGDGEVSITGLEIGGVITVTVDVIKGKNLPLPMLLNDSTVMTLASDVDLDVAVEVAVANMIEYLTKAEGFAVEDAVMLTSLVADVRICQVVNPLKTVRVEFPRGYA